MTALLAALLASTVALGVGLVVVGLAGRRPTIEEARAELHRPRSVAGPAPGPGWVDVLAGGGGDRRRCDLTVCDRDDLRWVQDRLKWAGLVAALALLATVVLPLAAGGASSPAAVAGAVAAGATGGWFWAIADLRADAQRARRRLRHAVAAYLELVTILMAGGAGPESAMWTAAEVGRGPSFRHLRRALAAAQARQEPPWSQLGQLGERLGVSELIELGSSMELAGGGAHVKDSLVAKAHSIRLADLAAAEAHAQARSETMALPVVMMFTGFLLLLGYPALAGLAAP
ncbi:MAG: hypothetical protein ACFCVK_11920 [Acidimicrobiales bacterium]